MADPIEYLNPNHIQANKLAAKYNAAYPILLLPLRLETRFMHIEPDLSSTTTTTHSSDYVLTEIGNKSNDGVRATKMGDIEQLITTLASKKKHLPEKVELEKVSLLTAWKYAAVSEALSLNSSSWMPNYRASIVQMKAINNGIAQTAKNGFPIARVTTNKKSSLLSSTQKEELTIYTNQLLQCLTAGDPIALTKGDYFIQILQQLVQQQEQWEIVAKKYEVVHPEDFSFIQSILAEIQEATLVWSNQAQQHITSFETQEEHLQEELYQIQTSLEEAYNLLKEESPHANQVSIWRYFSGIHQRLPLYREALKKQHYSQLNDLLSTIEAYVNLLIEPINQLDEYSLYIMAHTLMLQVELKELATETTQHIASKKEALGHYHTITEKIKKEADRAIEQQSIDSKSIGSIRIYLDKMESIAKLLQILPTTLSDWSGAQVLLNTELRDLTLALTQIEDVNKENQQQLLEKWEEINNYYSQWQKAISTIINNLDTTLNSAKEKLSIVEQNLSALSEHNFNKQAALVTAQAWQSNHQWRLYTERIRDKPSWNAGTTVVELSQLKQLVEVADNRLRLLDGRSSQLNFALGDNLGKTAAFLTQVTSMHTGVQELVTQHNNQLKDYSNLLYSLGKRISVQKEGTDNYAVLEASLGYLQTYITTIANTPIPTDQLELLLYDYWELEQLLEAVLELLSAISVRSEKDYNALNNTIDSIVSMVQNRMDSVNEWLNTLKKQSPEIEELTDSIQTLLVEQSTTYLKEEKNPTLFLVQEQAEKLQYLSQILSASLKANLSSNTILKELEITAINLANQATKNTAVAPIYKNRVNHALGQAKQVVKQSIQSKQQAVRNSQLVEHLITQQYQSLTNTSSYLRTIGEGEPLSTNNKQSLQQLVEVAINYLQQGSTLMANANYTQRNSPIIGQQLVTIEETVQELNTQGLLAEDKNTIEAILAPLEENYTEWNNSITTQKKLLKKQLQALEEQGRRIQTAVQNGQTGIAAMATNGKQTGRYRDKDIICWFPLGPGGGTTGGGNTGGTTDPTEISNHELWIRAYPDDIAINNHEQRLTDSEIQDAIIYWTAVWNAVGNSSIELGAWRVLVGKYGSERAAWIIRQMTPTNINKRPKAVTVANTTIEDIRSMSINAINKAGDGFWENILLTQTSLEEQTGLINNFQKVYPSGKAEALSYLTQPNELGQMLYERVYEPAAPSGIDQAGHATFQVATAQIEQRKQQLIQQQRVAGLTNPTPQFPVLAPEQRRDNTWSMAAYTDVMPDQLVFLLYNWEGEVVHEVVGNLIPEKLQIGIDPNDETQFDPTKTDLGIPSDTIKWMTNFEEAIAKGMAVKIPISTEEGAPETTSSTADAGFSRVYVLGIKHYDREEENTLINTIEIEGQQQIEGLLEAHHYTKGGLAILPPGTPTNNTSGNTSEFSFLADDVKDTYQTEIQYQLAPNKDPKRPADGHILAEALGINAAVFKHVAKNRGSSSHNAELMNKALWMTTWGLYLEEMFGNKDGFFPTTDFLPQQRNSSFNLLHYFKIPEDIDKVYHFFTSFVKGRGGLPSIRVGKQPYGILTTGVLQDNSRGWKWQDAPAVGSQNELSKEFLENFQELLLSYLWGYQSSSQTSKKWLQVVEEHIRTVDDTPNNLNGSLLTGVQEQFMKILRLHPTAATYYARYALNPYSLSDNNTTYDYQALFRGPNVSQLGSWLEFNTTLQAEFDKFIDYYDNSGHYTANTGDIVLNDLRLFELNDNLGTKTLQPLTGAVVDEQHTSSEKEQITPINAATPNYIKWLCQTSPDEIITRNQQPNETFDAGGEPSTTLLYTSLRNALLNQYWDAAMRILDAESFKDYSLKHYSSSNGNGWDGYSLDMSINYVQLDRTNKNSNHYYYNFGLLKRDSYKVFIKDVKPHVNNGTANVVSDPDYSTFPHVGHRYIQPVPYFGTDVITAGGRLPFLMEVNTDDVAGIPASNMTMAAYLFPGTGIIPLNALMDYPQETAALKAMLDALKILANQPVAELERLFAEHMDLASHRLDAWILGMANKRLQTIRENNSTGTYLGSYGWLMNLKPGGQRTAVDNATILYNVDHEGNAPVMADPDNQGYIQAPSLNHAMTAAVLRSGYEAHKGTIDENLLAINLSSERVKRALFYIEGIRNGQHLGALLGYRLERHLREANLAQYTLLLRQNYPIQRLDYKDSNQQPLVPTSPNSVIDGLAVVEKLRTMESTGESFAAAFSYINPTDETAVSSALDKIAQDMDALADLSLAEGTYQMVIGNYGRSNAMMSALSKGTPIPEPEIVKTPRTGQTLTHRVGMTLAAVNTTTSNPVWAMIFTPRALAEPALNAKLGELLPIPTSIQSQVEYQCKDGNGLVTTEVVVLSLADLQIEPIDLLYIFPDSIQDRYTELAKRFHRVALLNARSASTNTFYDFKVDFEWSNGSGNYSVADITPLLAQIQLLCANSRYLRASDLVHPTANTSNLELTGVSNSALQELANRANNLRGSLEQVANNLSNISNRNELWTLTHYGIQEAALTTPTINNIGTNVDDTSIITTVKKLAIDRVAQYDKTVASITTDPTLEIADKVELYQKAVSKLLGKSFLLLPQILPLNVAELTNAYSAGSSILPMDEPMAVESWTAGVARVRRQVNRLENVSFLQGLFLNDATASLNWSPIQLPYRPNDHWVGLELPENYYKEHFLDTNPVSLDKLSLVMNWHTSPNNTPCVGLLLDEWTEKIPMAEETAGLAFHYDQPNSKAPQSILLAVHPENSNTNTAWQWHQLVNTLDTTLALAKIRAVEPDHLQTKADPNVNFNSNSGFDAFSQLLPATFALVTPPNSDKNWSTDYHQNINTHLHKTN